MSIRAFAKAMQDREPRPRGSTRAMVHRYLSGATPPSDFIAAAADVLALNPEWLAFDKGHPTAGHDEVAGIAAEVIEESKRAEAGDMHAAVLRAMRAPVDYHPRYWTASVAEILRRADAGPFTPQLEAKHIGRALRAPLQAFGIEADRMGEDAFNDYVTAMVPVLLTIAAERVRQLPYMED